MSASYPNTIPSYTTKVDNTDVNWANDINRLQDEVVALASELGTTPKAGFATVAARLADLQVNKSDISHLHDARYVRRSLATSKGVIVVATGANDFSSLGAGTDGQTIVADGATSTGIRWQTLRHDELPGLGNDDHPQYLTGERHAALDHLGVFGNRSIRDFSDVEDVPPNLGDVPKWDGTQYSPQPDDDTDDHGGQAGLGDDDHPQYLNEARHFDRAMHDAIGVTHSSLTGLTTGHPHTQYPRKASGETISAVWNFTSRPTVAGESVVSNAAGGRKIFIQSGTPGGAINGDVWFRP
ncbi:MAG: hypothetical protein ABR616_03670 [Dermatophilaceae bacterium]|nr:hypothetical protein [Intrasporangiaceae bacterium]